MKKSKYNLQELWKRFNHEGILPTRSQMEWACENEITNPDPDDMAMNMMKEALNDPGHPFNQILMETWESLEDFDFDDFDDAEWFSIIDAPDELTEEETDQFARDNGMLHLRSVVFIVHMGIEQWEFHCN